MSLFGVGESGSSGFYSRVRKFFTNPMSILRRDDLTGISALCPISIDQIEPNLYLGSRSAAIDIKTLEKCKITHILSIEDAPLPDRITSLKKVKYIELSDQPQEDLLNFLEQTDDFISEGLAQGAVLVHCFFGVSRSASLVIAHIMKKYNLTYDEGYAKVQEKRSRIYPNPGFVFQLSLYKEMGYKLDPSNEKYRSFRLSVASNKFRRNKALPSEYMDVIKPDPGVDQSDHEMLPTDHYCCKKCHRILAQKTNLITHKYKGAICTKQYFFEPLTWMNVTNNSQNTLFCPQCRAEVGFFSWIAGHRCSCDVKVTPAFWLTPTEVDVTKPKI